MIYRIKPGNIRGQLQKARACCRVYHSSCQGNFCSFQTVMRHPLSIQGREITAKAGGMGATQPVWRAGVFGRALPPQKQTESWKDAHVNKAGRQLQLCNEAHPFPDQSLRQRDSPSEQSVLSGTSNSRGDLNCSHNLATCSQWLLCKDLHMVGILQLLKKQKTNVKIKYRKESFYLKVKAWIS